MMERRQFIVSMGLVTAGFGLFGPDGSDFQQNGASMKTAGFGWEIRDLRDRGANVLIAIANKIRLNFVDVDVSFMLLSPPAVPGFAEVLCRGAISRGGLPSFDDSQGHSYIINPASPDFGAVQPHDPNQLSPNFDPHVVQDWFFSVILKSFAPLDGAASSSQRHVSARPDATVNPGDYLVFHMDHAGVQGDGEMQIVIGYELEKQD